MATKPIEADLSKQICVVTGANTGLGKETARALAELGATVVLACRSAERGEAARADIVASTGNSKVSVVTVDLSRPASVREFARKLAAQFPKVHVLVNNAGAWWTTREVSADGVEMQWATNVLGPHLLTQEILPLLKAAGGARIVNVASTAAGGLDLADPEFKSRKYSGFTSYSASKQANRMLTWALAARLKGTGVTANSLSPGFVRTELNRSVSGAFRVFFALTKPLSKTPREGADTSIWLAASPEVEGVTGKFFIDRKETPCKFRDPAALERLWDFVEGQTRENAPLRAIA